MPLGLLARVHDGIWIMDVVHDERVQQDGDTGERERDRQTEERKGNTDATHWECTNAQFVLLMLPTVPLPLVHVWRFMSLPS